MYKLIFPDIYYKIIISMNREFFETNEREGFEKLKALNDAVHLFPEVYQTPKLTDYDASATTIANNVYNIEIKIRHQVLLDDMRVSGVSNAGNSYIEPSIMIESHKLASNLLHAHYDNTTPIYVNFLDDGNIIIFNLHKLRYLPQKKVTQTYSRGYQRKEGETKFYLSMADACIFDKNYNLIKRASDDKPTNSR